MEHDALILRLQRALDRRAEAKTKVWWDGYMKGAISFRGVGLPGVREELIGWHDGHALGDLPPADQLELALALLAGERGVDKLAGILYLQIYLRERLPWAELVEAAGEAFERRLIFDWSTCDWLCVRVLGPLISTHGLDCAGAIAGWRTEEYLWHARASLVPFVKVAGDPDLRPLMLETAAVLIRREERFAKTAVGWVLRDLSKHDEAAVRRFLDRHLARFSIESLRNATKYFEEAARLGYLERFKERRSSR